MSEWLDRVKHERDLNMEAKAERGTLTIIVGNQFGSEGKGAVAQDLAPIQDVAVRIGAPNAGHTVYDRDGEKYVMQQIPCNFINPNTKLVLGREAQIRNPILQYEIKILEGKTPIRDRLFIDPHAQIITDEEVDLEAMENLGERIGSTSARSREGIGQASADKALRSSRVVLARDFPPLRDYLADTTQLVNQTLEDGMNVLIEGTQGFGLSIDYGEYPFCTSRNVTTQALCNGVGVNPNRYNTDVIGVTRAFPIRVAGNSGPFPADSRELSWAGVRKIGGRSDLQPEQTSVTKMQRRIAEISFELHRLACMVNGPTEIALTFTDYLNELQVEYLIERLQKIYPEAPVTMLGVGPNQIVDIHPQSYRRIMLSKLALSA